MSEIQAVQWRDDRLVLLDQRLLPVDEIYLEYDTAAATADAIRDMVVRGAPAIGITAAYAVVLAARAAWAQAGSGWREAIAADIVRLGEARPTAVNLHWALARMGEHFPGIEGDPEAALLEEARCIHRQDIAANRRMGELGTALITPASRVLTHCNAGALATGGYGTALGVIRSAWSEGRLAAVYADETRPWLQGARLTVWELLHDRIPVRLLADGAAAWLMQSEGIDWVIVGADRIAANGDVANKIGTYGLAIIARHHGARMMVVAPCSTIDMGLADGGSIPIENRAGEELLELSGQRTAASGADSWNPVFDVTPAALIDVIVTERGVVERPDTARMRELMGAGISPRSTRSSRRKS